MEDIALSLVSHTNVGKTTLARTLLRKDVGTVFDQAHVTEVSDAWPLIESSEARLLLWDTPGFGDSARLLRRLRQERNPVGWFLHAVWDKVTDRALWCSQEAVRNIRDDADVVVYLVNAAEDPEDAAYVPLELEILDWLDCPVLLLLNQTGTAEDVPILEQRWREAVARFPRVRDVMSLDAFTRCWVQESALLERVSSLLTGRAQHHMPALVDRWNARNLEVFNRAVEAVSCLLAETATDREVLPSTLASKAQKQRAMTALAQRLEERLGGLMERLIESHGLDGEAASEVRERVEDFVLPAESLVNVRGGAIWGGLLTGAATGVTAEVMTGGLGFGSGVVVGAALGALGGAGLAKGFQIVLGLGKEPAVRWGADFLTGCTRQCALRYLAVAQFGRGRGAFRDDALDSGESNPWVIALDAGLDQRSEVFSRIWKQVVGPGGKKVVRWPSAATGAAVAERPVDLDLETGPDGSGAFAEDPKQMFDEDSASQRPRAPRQVSEQVRGLLGDILTSRYPEARTLLSGES
jgi:GTPase SAR1 family protein